MKIIRYEETFRDDMIFMNLYAKDALGKIPHLREDLLNIEEHYFNKGGYFWLAINENNRVIGSIGIKPCGDVAEIKRLFVKPDLKRQGIGSKLLETLENYQKLYNVRQNGNLNENKCMHGINYSNVPGYVYNLLFFFSDMLFDV